MKHIVSISLGSSLRNHSVRTHFLNEEVCLERIGSDGDLNRACHLIRKYDGKVSAIGLGGIDLNIFTRKKKFTFREARKLVQCARLTPVADGSGLKNTLERKTIQWINEHYMSLENKKILLVSAVDRFGMAEEFYKLKATLMFGDLVFGLRIPLLIRSYTFFEMIAHILLPIVTQISFKWLYPTGKEQHKRIEGYDKYFEKVDIVAGDWLMINRFLPQSLEDKIIITNTLTSKDIKELEQRKVRSIITTTPHLDGRSFGTNVLEALILAFVKKTQDEIEENDYLEWIEKLNLKPFILEFKSTQ